MAWIRACGGGSPAIPDGRTVTPINDVTIWQQCAGIANPTYTTLAEIMADVGVLSVLMASNNAVDYLVRSKEFLGKALVPMMTGTTTPSGECISSSEESDRYSYKAFDANGETYWSATSGTNEYIGYIFPTIQKVNAARFSPLYENGLRVQNFKIQASSDGNTWVNLYSGSCPNTNGYVADIKFSNNNSYRYYRLNISDSYNGYIRVNSLQFYSESICDNANAMQYIGANNYCANTLLADSDWCSAICNSAYFESVLNVKVPTMTSNTTPSGVASANSSSANAYKAFDNDASSTWSSDLGSNTWVQYLFAQSCMVCKVLIHANYTSAGSRLKNFSIQASADGNTWDTLHSGTYANSDTDQVFVISNQTSYEYYRLFCNDLYVSGWGIGIITLQFYGRADV